SQCQHTGPLQQATTSLPLPVRPTRLNPQVVSWIEQVSDAAIHVQQVVLDALPNALSLEPIPDIGRFKDISPEIQPLVWIRTELTPRSLGRKVKTPIGIIQNPH